MLLMDRYFFFSTDFCEWIIEWADAGDFNRDEKMVYAIQKREMIGNLSDAIYGYEFTGFIGEVYKRFPFPEKVLFEYPERFEKSGNKKIIHSNSTLQIKALAFCPSDAQLVPALELDIHAGRDIAGHPKQHEGHR